MAVKKSVTESNGVTTTYHRVALVSIDVNNQCTILVHSYISEDGRNIEKDYAAGNINGDAVQWPYVDAKYLSFDYDGEMTVERAYAYLKSLPQYAGAVDA